MTTPRGPRVRSRPAPLPQAQLVESRLLNLVHYATLVASKAARCKLAAPDNLLVDRDGRVLPKGQSGEVVVTHLATRDFPFIRYRTGDVAILSEKTSSN